MSLYIKLHERKSTGKPKAMFLFSRDFEKMEYTTGFGIPILQYVSAYFDPIVITGKDSDISHFKKHAEVWGFSGHYLGGLKDNSFKRAVEMEGDDTNWEYNQKIVVDELTKSFGDGYFQDLSRIFVIDLIDFVLPQTGYVSPKDSAVAALRKNEFHDTVHEDADEIRIIKATNKKLAEKYYSRCSVLAFGSHNKNISMALIDWGIKQSNKFEMAYAFVIDPAVYTPIFTEWKIPFTAYYFADDKRGTRDFKEFPIGQLQHLLWDETKKKKDLLSVSGPIVKDKDFFFAGTIFQEKGSRSGLYGQFLQHLRLPNSDLYIPQRANGMVYTKSNNAKNVNKVVEKFNELYQDVINHPMYADHLVPAEYEDVVKRYKYGMVFRCVSYYDSLNFRPILYARLRILPLLDPEYDPTFIQIPEDIQQHLIVNNDKEIAERVKYFNENPQHRESLLDQLESKFETKTFAKNWKNILSSYITINEN
jgi:hypothetical protein